MTKITWFCDICGGSTDAYNQFHPVKLDDCRTTMKHFDLCADCYGLIIQHVDTMVRNHKTKVEGGGQ